METEMPMLCPGCGRKSPVIANGYNFRFKCKCRQCGVVWKVFNRMSGKVYRIEIEEEIN